MRTRFLALLPAKALRYFQILAGILLLIHLLVLAGVLPRDIVWGGAITNQEELVRFQSIAITATLVMVAIVTLKVRLRNPDWLMRVFDVLSWGLFFYLLVNLLGNVFAPTLNEKLLFTPFTLLMAICALRIAILRPGKTV